jgi:hypothetical protein
MTPDRCTKWSVTPGSERAGGWDAPGHPAFIQEMEVENVVLIQRTRRGIDPWLTERLECRGPPPHRLLSLEQGGRR